MRLTSRSPAATAGAFMSSPRARAAWLRAAVVLLAAGVAAPAPSAATEWPGPPHPPVSCVSLATDPANGLLGNPVVKTVTSQIVPASPPNVSHCRVDLLYGTSDDQNINIRVGLPLNSLDGGAGGVEGAWNGRTQGVGGGGCAGNLNVNGPVNAGYVGSGTELIECEAEPEQSKIVEHDLCPCRIPDKSVLEYVEGHGSRVRVAARDDGRDAGTESW